MNALGERLHFARKKRGYTQDSLTEVIGVSRGVIYNLEKNKTEPQMIVINAICQTLNISRDWLLYGWDEIEDRSELSKSVRILVELYDVAKGLLEDEQFYLLDAVKALKLRLSKGARQRPSARVSDFRADGFYVISDKTFSPAGAGSSSWVPPSGAPVYLFYAYIPHLFHTLRFHL